MTTARTTEIELKYRVTDSEAAERLVADHRLGDLIATGPARTSQHEDHYVDTADGALARAGFAVRLRQAGGATIVSIKSLARDGGGALHRRVELEGPADRATRPHDWPGSAARSMILELAGDAPLVQLVALRQLRRKRRYARDGTEVELSLDSVDVVDRGRIIDSFRELEVELVAGDPAVLDGLAERLADSPGLDAAERSKYELALDAAGIVIGRTSAGPGDPAGRPSRARSRAKPPESTAAPVVAEESQKPAEPMATSAPATGGPADPTTTGETNGAATDRPPTSPTTNGSAPLAGDPDAESGSTPGTTSEDPAGSPRPARTGAGAARRAASAKAAEAPVGASEAPDAAAPESAEALPILVVGKTPGVRADDTLAEAGRKILRFHLARMLAREPGTRTGEDIEDLHSMRVATRRMRAAWRVFGDAYRPGRTRRYRRDLRDVARRLGAVRDLDVLLDGIGAYAKTQSAQERDGLEPLVAAWRRRREEAQVLLLRTLDTPAYGRFSEEYREFVSTDGLAVLPVAPTAPHRVRDRMPSRIWTAYEQVRGYEPVLRWADVETLHELRIAAKWLRYTIEFVREPLGVESAVLIERVVALQDHLGYLHDADVAANLARSFLVEHAGDLSDHETAAIGRYLIDRERELARLRRTVGPTWRRVAGLAYRRALARTIAGL